MQHNPNRGREPDDPQRRAAGRQPAEPSDGPGLFVGFTSFAPASDISAQGGINLLDGQEAWVVKAVGGDLVLAGGHEPTHRGILYVVYHFLEDVVGVRWWNPMGSCDTEGRPPAGRTG